MSEDQLRKQLQALEDDYVGQPPVVQQADLPEINRLRVELGMPLVNEELKELGVDESSASEAGAPSEQKTNARDHTEARQIYKEYLQKIAELEVHQAYADRVVKATAGAGKTPVRPLATMGTGGGPLLCDYCGKAIVLEGGQFNGVTADVAWQQAGPRDNWTSFIAGGMVVDLKVNGTVRIYHGYPGPNLRQCCNIALREEKKERESFTPKECPVKTEAMLAFFEDELPPMTRDERYDLLVKVTDTMFPVSFDPGIGRNRP